MSRIDPSNLDLAENFHVGFLVHNGVDQVNDLYQRLQSAGFEAPAPKKFHDSWGFYVVAPGGVAEFSSLALSLNSAT